MKYLLAFYRKVDGISLGFFVFVLTFIWAFKWEFKSMFEYLFQYKYQFSDKKKMCKTNGSCKIL